MRVCAKCHQTKLESEFSFKIKEKNRLMSYCKTCNRIYQQWHYQQNRRDYRTKHIAYRIKVDQTNRQKILEFLAHHPCVDCAESDPIVLEFDHVGGDKKENISVMVGNSLHWDTILAEIKKCEVRCANCHKRRTAKQFGWYKSTMS